MLEYLCNLSEKRDVDLSIKPIFLLVNSMSNNYNCSDVLVRLLAIDCYYGKNNYGFTIYNEMQRKRVLKNPNIPNDRAYNQKRFEKLIKSFEISGFKREYPIQINKELEFLDGSHRLALSLYHHIENIPVYFSESRLNRKVDYSLEWFKKEGMEKYENIILKKYRELMNEYKEKLVIIIIANLREIEIYKEKLSENTEIKLKKSVEFNNDKTNLLMQRYNFFEDILFIGDRKIQVFEVEVNYKIRTIKIVNDKKKTIYEEFNLCNIPYIVLSEKSIIKEILMMEDDSCE